MFLARWHLNVKVYRRQVLAFGCNIDSAAHEEAALHGFYGYIRFWSRLRLKTRVFQFLHLLLPFARSVFLFAFSFLGALVFHNLSLQRSFFFAGSCKKGDLARSL